MKHRERVEMALNHEAPDRCPMQISFTPEFAARLRAALDLGGSEHNPIQPASMDPAEVKRRYGDQLCFWGSIDEQHTLPFGTPADVEREVQTRLETIGRSGGLILGPTHHLQLDTPLENLRALVDKIVNTPYR